MRTLGIVVLATCFPFFSFGQVAPKLAPAPDPGKELRTVTASCGQCNFGLPGGDCDLAVRFPQQDGAEKAFYVDGVDISAFGHPHDKDGFCLALRKAEVQGEVVEGRFKASYFKLLPPEKEGKAR